MTVYLDSSSIVKLYVEEDGSEEVRQFVQCVRDDLPTPTTGIDGRAAVVLGYAAWKSVRENRPVKISEIC